MFDSPIDIYFYTFIHTHNDYLLFTNQTMIINKIQKRIIIESVINQSIPNSNGLQMKKKDRIVQDVHQLTNGLKLQQNFHEYKNDDI